MYLKEERTPKKILDDIPMPLKGLDG